MPGILNFIDEKLMHGCSASFSSHGLYIADRQGRDEREAGWCSAGMEDLRERLRGFAMGMRIRTIAGAALNQNRAD